MILLTVIFTFMQRFIKTELVSLIKESTQGSVSIEEWEQSYEAFASALFETNAKPCEPMKYNALCYVKAEFVFWKGQNSLKNNETVLSYIEKAMCLTDT
jgi:hypothetical protein